MIKFFKIYWALAIAPLSHTIIGMILYYNKSYWYSFLESFIDMPVLAGGKSGSAYFHALYAPLANSMEWSNELVMETKSRQRRSKI